MAEPVEPEELSESIRGHVGSRTRLPSLRALEAFSVVGRTGSIASAADILSLTSSAVSHRIRTLEDDLGLTLFERSPRGLVLTEVGQHYFHIIDAAFDRIGDATASLRRGGLVDTLGVNVVHALAANWIFPRLAAFYDRHPGLTLAFHPKTSLEYSSTMPSDLRGYVEIRFGRGDWPGFHCTEILRCKTFPVCSPALLEGPNPLRTPADLAAHTWLHTSLYPQAWPDWLAAAGYPDLRAVRDLVQEDSELKRQAAVHGLGVALTVDVLVEGDLALGTLVEPFDIRHDAAESYYLLCHPDDVDDPRVRAFREWLLELAAPENPA